LYVDEDDDVEELDDEYVNSDDQEEEEKEEEEDIIIEEKEEEEFDENSIFPQAEFEGMDTPTTLAKMIAIMKERKLKAENDLKIRKQKVAKAKSSISSLIENITEYKTALEKEQKDLEIKVSQIEENLRKERETNEALSKFLEDLDKEKQILLESIEKLEKQQTDEFEEENKIKNAMKQENIQNLQTLMDELQRIEEANEMLRSQYEKILQQIEDEKRLYEETLDQLRIEREKVERQKDSSKHNSEKKKQKQLHKSVSKVDISKNVSISRSPSNETNSIAISSESFPLGKSEWRGSVPVFGAANEEELGKIADSRRMSLPVSASPYAHHQQQQQKPQSQTKEQPYQLLKTLQPNHDSAVISIAPVGSQMWIGSASGNIRIWEMETAEMLEDRYYHTAPVQCILMVKDQVWTSSKDKSILIFSTKKSAPLKRITLKECYGNAMLEVDQFIWIACSDGNVRLFDKNIKNKKDLKVDNSALLCMLKRSNQVYIGTHQGVIHLWNTTTLRVQKSIVGHVGPVVGFTAIGPAAYPSQIWSHSHDKTVRCWSVENHECIRILPSLAMVLSSVQVRTTCHVLVGTDGPSIDVWNAKTYEIVSEMQSYQKGVYVLMMDIQNRIWSGSADNTVCIWIGTSQQ